MGQILPTWRGRFARPRGLGEGAPVRQFIPLLALLFVLGPLGCEGADSENSSTLEVSRETEAVEDVTAAEATFVGTLRCAECHTDAAEAWSGSHHDLAMVVASASSILGDFEDVETSLGGDKWGFHREGDAFVVTHTPSDGPTERRRVEATFGVTPLQQLLVPEPGGRLQAWPIAWDSRPKQVGGQRWFSIHGDEQIPSGDPLHWQGGAMNWNSQCAACHSTALVKSFDDARDRFDTTSVEINVGCEACHGPGSAHSSWAVSSPTERGADPGLPVAFEAWSADHWARQGQARIATREVPRVEDHQLDTCAPCHSRRAQLKAEPAIGAALLDGYSPRLLDETLYFDDGQIRDEVYVWGSFIQSRMHEMGVRCADCHDPHSLSLRREGNALCTGCHASEAFDVPTHRGHDGLVGKGTECVDCHMPERTYMVVDPRRDHSFPIPRPLRSHALGTPDACGGCHADRGAAWAANEISNWRGDRPEKPHWSDGLVTDGERRVDPERWLGLAYREDLPDWVRGSGWSRYAAEAQGAPPLALLQERFASGGALERLGLIDVAERLSPMHRLSLLRPVLDDPLLALRLRAAQALADLPADRLRPADRAALARALREARAANEANAERPEAQVALGLQALRYGDAASAREAYEKALARAPFFVPARVNLADLARSEGNEREAIEQLRAALEYVPEDGLVRYALGLALHRAGEAEGALRELEQASESAPLDPRITLGYALALDGQGRRSETLGVLGSAIDEGRGDGALYQALVSFLREEGRMSEARARAEAWLTAYPDDPQARSVLGDGGGIPPG